MLNDADSDTRVAALIYFSKEVDVERVNRWIEKLKEQGHVDGSVAREYDSRMGEPVWYMP